MRNDSKWQGSKGDLERPGCCCTLAEAVTAMIIVVAVEEVMVVESGEVEATGMAVVAACCVGGCSVGVGGV